MQLLKSNTGNNFKCPKMGYSNFKSPASLQCGIVTECCSVVWEGRTFPCNTPISWAEQRLSSALVLQQFRDSAWEQHKLYLILFPEGSDWSNVRSRLHWPVENLQCLIFFFPPLLAKASDINFTPTGSQRKEREVQWQMATHKEARTAYCTLALCDKDNFTVT